MSDKSEVVTTFLRANDVDSIRTTLHAITLRDCKVNPDLYQDSKIEEELVELGNFLGRLKELTGD